MQDSISPTMYTLINEKIEKCSKLGHDQDVRSNWFYTTHHKVYCQLLHIWFGQWLVYHERSNGVCIGKNLMEFLSLASANKKIQLIKMVVFIFEVTICLENANWLFDIHAWHYFWWYYFNFVCSTDFMLRLGMLLVVQIIHRRYKKRLASCEY